MNFKDTINFVIEVGISEKEVADVFAVSEKTIERYRDGSASKPCNSICIN